MNLFVYVLEDKYGAMYIGLSYNLDKRYKQHLAGTCSTTRKMHRHSLKIRHFWIVPTYSLASRFERYLHSITKSEVLDMVLDCKYWCKDLEDLALTKPLQTHEALSDSGKMHTSLNAIVSLPNKDQLARII